MNDVSVVDVVEDVAFVVVVVVDVVFVEADMIVDALIGIAFGVSIVDVSYFVVTVVDHIAVAVVGEEDSVGALIFTVVVLS